MRAGWLAVPAVLAFTVLAGCGQARETHDGAAGSPTGRATTAHAATTAPRGDLGPHEAENNGWKQRATLSADDRRAAQAAAQRIRPALERLRRAGEFTPESVQRALSGLGYQPDAVQVRAFSAPAAAPAPTAPPGTVYGVRVGERGCVYGAVSPDEASAQVDGPTAEWGCIEPGPSH